LNKNKKTKVLPPFRKRKERLPLKNFSPVRYLRDMNGLEMKLGGGTGEKVEVVDED